MLIKKQKQNIIGAGRFGLWQRRGRGALAERLTGSQVMHASWVRIPRGFFLENFPCFSLLNVTSQSR